VYIYKPSEELKWALLAGLSTFATEVLVNFRPEEIKEPETWFKVAAGALVRSLVVALLAAFGKAKLAREEAPKRRRKTRGESDRLSRPLPPREPEPVNPRGIDGPRL
jgi:hypothetical protein